MSLDSFRGATYSCLHLEAWNLKLSRIFPYRDYFKDGRRTCLFSLGNYSDHVRMSTAPKSPEGKLWPEKKQF